MGKAARERRRRDEHVAVTAKPIWAGANGFDVAWDLTRQYVFAGSELEHPAELLGNGEHKHSIHELEVIRASNSLSQRMNEVQRHLIECVLLSWFKETEEDLKRRRERAKTVHNRDERELSPGFGVLGREHQRLLEKSTPLLFDPLLVPTLGPDALQSLQLPFPVVTCDFLADNGLCLPLALRGQDDTGAKFEGKGWIGLVAATITEPHPHVYDVWPVVTPLSADNRYHPVEPFLMGYGRLGHNSILPVAPAGLISHEASDMIVEDGEAWVWMLDSDMEEGEPDTRKSWRDIWSGSLIVQAAAAALGALTILDAVNVEIEDAQMPRAERRRAIQRHGSFTPAKEVIVRHKQSKKEQQGSAEATSQIDWRHRWTVRGHWKHFTKGPFFDANPRKRVQDPVHGECIKVWCPPFIKGPDGLPLVLKSRRVIE